MPMHKMPGGSMMPGKSHPKGMGPAMMSGKAKKAAARGKKKY